MRARALELLLRQQEGGADGVDGLIHEAEAVGNQRTPGPGQVRLLRGQRCDALPLQAAQVGRRGLQRLGEPHTAIASVHTSLTLIDCALRWSGQDLLRQPVREA
jgi:hypothetical protein